VNCCGRVIFIADGNDGKRFIVGADEKLMAVVELEAATQAEQPIG
jgi:hypothetical protein